MSDDAKFQQTVLSELAGIHASLALMEDCFFHMQSGGLSDERKKQLAAVVIEKKRAKLRILCSQAGVAYPPEMESQR